MFAHIIRAYLYGVLWLSNAEKAHVMTVPKCGIVTWGKRIEHEHDALADLCPDHSCCSGGSSFLKKQNMST